MPSGSVYSIFILTFYLTFFLAYFLTSILTSCLASILTHFLAYILTFCLTFYLAPIPTSFLAFIFWHSFWHSIWYIFGDSLWLRSGEDHFDPEDNVRVRQELLQSRACSWGPAGTTAIKSLQFRPGGDHWDKELAVEFRRGPLRSRACSWGLAGEKEREAGGTADMKSNNLQLTGGDKYRKHGIWGGALFLHVKLIVDLTRLWFGPSSSASSLWRYGRCWWLRWYIPSFRKGTWLGKMAQWVLKNDALVSTHRKCAAFSTKASNFEFNGCNRS